MTSNETSARLLSNDVLAKWLIEAFPFRIQLAPGFPFYPITGHELRYATTDMLTPGATIEFSGPIPEDTKEPKDPNRVFKFAEIATHFRISYNAQDIFSSNVNDQTAVQMALAIRELLYKFWTLFESGDSDAPQAPQAIGGSANLREFDGLLKLVDPSKVVDLKCQPLTLEALEQAKELVRTNDGRCVVIFTSSIGKRAIHAAHWQRGLKAEYEEMEFPSPRGVTKRQKVVTFDGAPVFVNDLNQIFECGSQGPGKLIPPEQTMNLDGVDLGTHIWFFVMGKNNLHGMTPASLGSSMFVTRSTILPDGSTCVYHVTMPVGIALGSASALSVIKNATIPTAAGIFREEPQPGRKK